MCAVAVSAVVSGFTAFAVIKNVILVGVGNGVGLR
jgi:hypothetical protein